jgi:hypothetical protein
MSIVITKKIKMASVTFEKITLDWIKADYLSFPNLSGVYQIYGSSPLYGIDTLLYIGQAKNLKNRICCHLGDNENVIGRQANLSCRYAGVPEHLLDVVEQTLIVMYKPSFNSIGLKNVKSSVKEKGYYIQNHGERGMLNFETTNYYFLADLKDIIMAEEN